jgi:hypothetical protein
VEAVLAWVAVEAAAAEAFLAAAVETAAASRLVECPAADRRDQKSALARVILAEEESPLLLLATFPPALQTE